MILLIVGLMRQLIERYWDYNSVAARFIAPLQTNKPNQNPVRKMQKKLSFLFLILICMGFKGPGDEEPIVRPLDPFVFRTTLDDRPRMISLALHPQLWVAYDAATCGLYKAWNGRIKFQGAVFNNVPGPQPIAEGFEFITNREPETRWRIEQGGKDLVPQTHFKGYEIVDNKLTFHFELEMPDGHRIKVTEYPEFDSKRSGNMTGISRTFTTENVPSGINVKILIDYQGLLFGSDLKTDGKLVKKSKLKRHFDWGTAYDYEGAVILNANESTEFTVFLL